MLLTALVLGVFIPIVQATTGTANEVRSRVVVDVYVKESATPAQQDDLRARSRTRTNVKSVEFISKAQALERAKEKNPKAFEEGAELLGTNPLPASFRVTPEDPDKLDSIVSSLDSPGGSRGLAGRRRGAQPGGRHGQDPVRHRPREGAHRRARGAAASSRRSR